MRYTTCPVGEEDWVLRASDIDIRQRAGLGFGRGVRLDFKGVPILYTPFISFPVGNQRKSGFLFPDARHLLAQRLRRCRSRGTGTSRRTTTRRSRRLISPSAARKLDSEFRYLTDFGRGTLDTEYLPDDREFGDSRSLRALRRPLRLHATRCAWTSTRRTSATATGSRISAWARRARASAISNRSASLTYLTQHWLAVLRAQNFQTIDDAGIAPRAAAAHPAAAAGGARRVSRPARRT